MICYSICPFYILSSNLLIRYIWVDKSSETLHASKHKSKCHRHRAADLSRITAVLLPGLSPQNEGQTGGVEDGKRITIVFKTGGNVDLMFNFTSEFDQWKVFLTGVVGRNEASVLY